MVRKLKILFLCTGNSCRSQMAEGWVRHLHPDILDAASAGTRPGRVDPRAVVVMGEAGVDISTQRSKHVDDFLAAELDWVVTVCDQANASCPVFPGNLRRMHVGFDDPPRMAADAATEQQALDPYRRVRDEIRQFVDRLPGRLRDADDVSAKGR